MRAMPNRRTVRDLFAQIAGRYDLLNHVLSCSVDRLWRRRLVRLAGAGGEAESVIDICCGTGDIALAFRRKALDRIVGADFSREMLSVAREKAHRRPGGRGIDLFCADALELPFADGSFSVATMGFGLRNLSDYRAGIAEAARVVRPGGRVLILEFAPPKNSGILFLYRLYLRFVIPIVGGILTGKRSAYEHLSDTIAGFLEPREVTGMMAAAGLRNPEALRLTGGIAYIYSAER
jgi:demethylmenaquinone methyltransferase / 2-methoxy-6-polyprenyl-1,4-benzoquinol methylase